MNAGFAVVFLALLIGLVIALLRNQRAGRIASPNSPLMAEYRTDLPLDACIDILRAPQAEDLFAYTFQREADGSFSLQFTEHRSTQQPIATLYSLRMESGRQTLLTLTFQREAFGYQEPVFPPALLDEFFATKLAAVRHIVQAD